jgi:hypothetical protein
MNCSNSTYRIAIPVLVACFALACTSTTEKGGVGGTSGVDGGVVGKSVDGAAGKGSGDTAGQGDSKGTGGAGGATTANVHAGIDLTQSYLPALSIGYSYSVSGGFYRYATVAQVQSGYACTASTIGECLTSVCIASNTGDAGTPSTPTIVALNAGVLTVTGAGASKATLVFGTISPSSSQQGYAAVNGATQFFTGGDAIQVMGAGGADLPAFPAQTVIAPSDITLTAPVCGGAIGTACAEVDRTQDLAVAWTGGGAGKVSAIFETLASTDTTSTVVIVECNFDAKSGAGTVPQAALALLGDTRVAPTSGSETFSVSNATTFTVANIPTTFTVHGASIGLSLSVSK